MYLNKTPNRTQCVYAFAFVYARYIFSRILCVLYFLFCELKGKWQFEKLYIIYK